MNGTRFAAAAATAVALFTFAPAATAAPIIKSVLTTGSASDVTTGITIFGTGLWAASNRSTKPTVTLGDVSLTGVGGASVLATSYCQIPYPNRGISGAAIPSHY